MANEDKHSPNRGSRRAARARVFKRAPEARPAGDGLKLLLPLLVLSLLAFPAAQAGHDVDADLGVVCTGYEGCARYGKPMATFCVFGGKYCSQCEACGNHDDPWRAALA